MTGTDRAKIKQIARPTVQTLEIALLLILSSTTEPLRCRNGSVVELKITMNRVRKGVCDGNG